ncbi:MAG: DUF2382 domain-containing protein, partial [Sphingomicrobium sp.]
MVDSNGPPATDLTSERPSEDVTAVPLMEERLSIAKELVECERVRVRVTVEERHETITEQLLRDDLEIERIPQNIRLTEAPSVRFEGDTTIVPIVKEVVVVEKALMLVEEVHIRRRSIA